MSVSEDLLKDEEHSGLNCCVRLADINIDYEKFVMNYIFFLQKFLTKSVTARHGGVSLPKIKTKTKSVSALQA